MESKVAKSDAGGRNAAYKDRGCSGPSLHSRLISTPLNFLSTNPEQPSLKKIHSPILQ